jgi:hypothetical protein
MSPKMRVGPALSGVPNIVPNDKMVAGSVNYGTFGGKSSMAGGGAVRLFVADSGAEMFANAAAAWTLGSPSATGGRAGFTLVW